MIRQLIFAGKNSTVYQAAGDIIINKNGPVELIDHVIEDEVYKLIRSRLFQEFDITMSALRLGIRLDDGNLSGGSYIARSRGLSWCARLLARSEEPNKAVELLRKAKALVQLPEILIAEAFILSNEGNKSAALKALTTIDSPASRGAALAIVAHHDGIEAALQWMKVTAHKAVDLDSFGKFFLLNYQLNLAFWDDAAQTVSALSETDFEEAPALHHLSAITKLIGAVPDDFRAVVMKEIPFEAKSFPLASDAFAMDARRDAHDHFMLAAEAAKRLSCPRATRICDAYGLWLELRDPAQSAHGKDRLQDKLRDTGLALFYVNFALQFGVKLDLDKVERDIDQHIALNGGMTIEAAIARYALAFTKTSDEEAGNYIARHYCQLAAYINPMMMRERQLGFYASAGLIEKANEVLDQLVELGLPQEKEVYLRRAILGAGLNNPVETYKAQYKRTGTLGDLYNLTDALEKHKQWDDLCQYGRELFEKTHSVQDAEILVNAFNNTHRSEELVNFLKEYSYLLSQSRSLKMSYAWGLYHEGALIESRAALSKLSEDAESPSYRALQVKLGISMGDWTSLHAYVAGEHQNREKRSAHDLMSAAQLALHLGAPRDPLARDLVFEAVAKAGDDAAILAAAYFFATSAGWEDDPKVFQWLETAAALSGQDGPIQTMSLKDILDRKPEWDRRESETWQLLVHGQIPIFLAGQSLNKTLINLATLPAIANLTVLDPRRRSAIPAYSGTRVAPQIDITGKTIALDATALLTLSFLNILDKALDAFRAIYIPHSTLAWLFEEWHNAAFHQPSRIKKALKVRDLIATGVMNKINPTTVASSDLSAQIGDHLAALIAEAEKIREGDNTQHIVVRPAPVHRLSSLMEEEADLSAHTAVMSSCISVVEKLRHKGQLTAEEERLARYYLQLREKPWPNQPKIADGATLYLDDVAIDYLLHLGCLGKLKGAGLRAVVSQREVSEGDALISYQSISDKVKDIIERIRASLNSRIESGHVRVGGRRIFKEAEEISISEHPSLGIIALAPYCDVAIVDDRFLNQHLNIDYTSALAPILSTLDLLDSLVAAGVISDEGRLGYRTQLRQAGYFFVSVSEDELDKFLRASDIVAGEVVETAELKAVRESVLRVRMSDWLQLPDESPWLDGTLKAFIRVLKNLWKDDANIEHVTARSNWLAKQLDIRGWAHSLIPDNADNIVRIGRSSQIILLLTPPSSVEQSIVDAYWNWVEERILAPEKEQFPELFEQLVEWYQQYIAEMAESELPEGDDS